MEVWDHPLALGSESQHDGLRITPYSMDSWEVGLLMIGFPRIWRHTHYLFCSSQVAQVVKYPAAKAGDTRDTGSIPGLERSPGVGSGNPLQYSCLENPMERSLVDYCLWDHKESDMTERVHTHTHCFCFFPDPQKPQVCLEPWVWISMAGPQWVPKKHHQPDQCWPLPESPPTPNHIHWVRRTPSLSIPSLAGPTMNPILLSCSQCLNSRPLRPLLLSVLFTATQAPCSFPS